MSGSNVLRRAGANWDRAHGAFLGLLCGDAAGATLEFAPGVITEADVSRAMTMPGGGVFGVGKGQITDDSELALSLARGLMGRQPSEGFPFESVARQYVAWCASKPFDIGNTCATAFDVQPDADGNYATTMTNIAVSNCLASEANGSLMRIAPLAIWSVGQSDETIAALAKAEATLSHPNQVCQDCNAVYCLMLEHVLRVPGDFQGAVHRGERYVMDSVNSVARTWFLEESLDVSSLVCTRQMGHVRWAFVLATHFLRQNESYERAIQQTLLKGGDTDTNAAIVGGLIGALHGVESIPPRMREVVLAFDASKPAATHRPRPVEYRGAQVALLVDQLLSDAAD
ncbi:ADP-ribosyl-[dinitrogen reductase] glycohydrolase [Phytophthora citrophthora]|uniref:ADP-ribosyl-[dinitrogen reductase] glycohydrolase n=1 Tax=Phytophthora citrophthora TaxID=4793 RepID=A0AAD9G1V9_9STRA|nr:ADP-ribosyl-[dinitrogen reductase] glycohydrolase [Phytophthora citrophthora]